jgi:phosphate:Na+ symporter
VAIVFIGPFRSAVDHLAAALGIAADDFTLKLALFHTLFNLVGIGLMLPLIRPLEAGLERLFRVRAPAVSQPRYLNDAARGFPEAALETVRLETRRLCDIVIKILLHGLSLKPGIVFSDLDIEEAVQASRKPMREDIDEQYHLHVKSLYSAIVEFISLAQVGASQQQSEQLHALRVAGGNLVEALKAVKHLRKNLLAAMTSGNPAVRREYDNIRILLARVLRHMDTLRKTDNPPVTVLSWDELRLEVEEADLSANGTLDSLIRHNRISATVATSLMNDIGYCQTACRKLIEMTNTLFPGPDPQFAKAEQGLSLDDTEIERIARTSPDKAA